MGKGVLMNTRASVGRTPSLGHCFDKGASMRFSGVAKSLMGYRGVARAVRG